MPFKYRVITANCGNDGIGEAASMKIAETFKTDDADFYVINCQEADFEKTKEQLQKQLGDGYTVECLAQMATHTKLNTQFSDKTGIATFVIHKKEVQVELDGSPKEARRENSRLSGGFNKGGLITNFKVTKEQESIKVQAISGHLDSNNTYKRNKDWAVLHANSAKDKVTNWQELVDASPHLVLSGYDANTRNKYNPNGESKNMWEEPTQYPEMHALYVAPLAGIQFSHSSTYDHTKGKKNQESDKRPGCVDEGMLDLVGIFDGTDPIKDVQTGEDIIKIEPEKDADNVKKSTARDHTVIISPFKTAPQDSNDFKRVTSQMASRLQYVAPKLAEEIRNMPMSEENQTKLVTIYQTYLSPNGLLNQAINLHADKLRCFDRVKEKPFLKDEELKNKISETLFSKREWCEGGEEKVKQNQELMTWLVNSLEQCEHEESIRLCLECYSALEKQIDVNQTFDVKERAFQWLNDRYTNSCKSFQEALNNISSGEIKDAGEEIKKQLEPICTKAQDNKNFKSLAKLTCIVEQCGNICKMLSSKEEDSKKENNLQAATGKLTSLAQEAKGHPFWHALAGALDKFANKISWVANLSMFQDKKILDTVAKFKSAVTPNPTGPEGSKEMDGREYVELPLSNPNSNGT